jgi:Xaa-Pro aminopeptidase
MCVDENSDFVGTFPANGRFTDDQKLIYNIVLTAFNNVAAQLAPGVEWRNLTTTAETSLAQGLLDVHIFHLFSSFFFFFFFDAYPPI